jgi:hypothetical protein
MSRSDGGSPAKGFRSDGVPAGSMGWTRRPRAGDTWVRRPFTAGPLGMGLALIGGFVLRICAVAGTVMVGLMRVAERGPPSTRPTAHGEYGGRSVRRPPPRPHGSPDRPRPRPRAVSAGGTPPGVGGLPAELSVRRTVADRAGPGREAGSREGSVLPRGAVPRLGPNGPHRGPAAPAPPDRFDTTLESDPDRARFRRWTSCPALSP